MLSSFSDVTLFCDIMCFIFLCLLIPIVEGWQILASKRGSITGSRQGKITAIRGRRSHLSVQNYATGGKDPEGGGRERSVEEAGRAFKNEEGMS